MSWRETVSCGCKINLRLKVTGKRSDGRHDLATLFWPLDHPGDVLEAADADAPALAVPGHPELENPDDLVWRAAMLYAEAAGIPPRWSFVLHKNAPVAAGLGGGSADAGATLALLNRRYGRLTAAELAALALKLGADVPFFLLRRPAWAAGTGELLTPLAEPGTLPETLIVFPGFPVSAAWAYAHLAPELIGPDEPGTSTRFASALAAPETAPWPELCRNDLAPALWRKFPLLTLLRDFLSDRGAYAAQVSGSGSSLFALFPPGRAVPAAEDLHEKFGHLAGLKIFAGGKTW